MTRESSREVLEDIVADGQRAGEVIRGIKGMLRKSEGARQLVDLNEVIVQTPSSHSPMRSQTIA
jgi:hypothetical protein